MAIQKPHSQADDRFSINPVDQFGRKWLLSIEIATRHPTGLPHEAGWADPLRNSHVYLRLVNQDAGVNVPPDFSRCIIDMDRWRRQMDELEREWKVNLFTTARQTYPVNFAPDKAEQDEYLLAQVGPRPFPGTAALDLIARQPQSETAQALLGLIPMTAAARKVLRIVTVEDLEAETGVVVGADYVGDLNNYRAFMADAMRRGLGMSEAAALWQTHKANMGQSVPAGEKVTKPAVEPVAQEA